MPQFTIETTYHLPVFRHVTYSAATPDAACRLAVEDDDWSVGKRDYETAGETYVTGIWRGDDAAYRGPAIPVPPHFGETVQRQAAHFEVLLGLLKMLFSDVQASRPTPPECLGKTAWAIARGEAILDGARGPDAPAGLPRPRHVLAELEEDRVRHQLAAILEVDDSFAGLEADAVTDADIHVSCLSVAASIDLTEEIGGAECRAALAALRQAQARRA